MAISLFSHLNPPICGVSNMIWINILNISCIKCCIIVQSNEII
uniref:Uncharacterized protein n=1 Tax=Rhizophora mucronata TaxID=61149 RepID=A0A2P2P3R1_RHIMU